MNPSQLGISPSSLPSLNQYSFSNKLISKKSFNNSSDSSPENTNKKIKHQAKKLDDLTQRGKKRKIDNTEFDAQKHSANKKNKTKAERSQEAQSTKVHFLGAEEVKLLEKSMQKKEEADVSDPKPESKFKFSAGIRKLDPKVIQRRLFPELQEGKPLISLLSLIGKMIEKDNEGRKEKQKVVPLHYAIEKKWEPKEHNGFDLKAYTIAIEGIRKTTRAHKEEGFSSEQKLKNSAHIDFFYRESSREIYAITTDQTYQILTSYTDYSWPKAFCKKFLDPMRITQITRKFIFKDEKERMSKFTIPQKFELIKDRDCIYSEIILPVRDSSPLSLLHSLKGRDTSVKVQTSQIRFTANFEMGDFANIVSHDSDPSNSEISQVMIDLFEPLDYMVKVEDPELVIKLKSQIQHEIWKTIQSKEVLKNYSFCPTFLSDYTQSKLDKLFIQYDGKKSEIKKFATLNEIIEEIRLKFHFSKTLSSEEIDKKFQTIHVSYDEKKLIPLIDSILGEITYAGKIYFRINKCFYYLSGDYLSLVHIDFRRNLNELLLPSNHPGALQIPWGGQKVHGNITSTMLKKWGLSEAEKQSVCYLEKKEDHYSVNFSKLKGEILNNTIVREYQQKLENYFAKNTVLKNKELNELFKIIGIGEPAFNEILEELTQQRKIFKKEKDKLFVINPLIGDKKISNDLSLLCDKYFAREGEGDYNELYLYDKKNHGKLYGADEGFLVGDRILPFGIEIFDILYYTKDTTYIYHVKEGFDLHTRDALSQLTNSVEMIYEAKYAATEMSVLDKWFELATDTKTTGASPDRSYREKLAKQANHLGKEAFKDIFLKRKLVFVYAVLDSHEEPLSLAREQELKERFNPVDFDNESLTKTKDVGQKIFTDLKSQNFLDSKGRLTSKFYASSKERFTKDFIHSFSTEIKKNIYDILHAHASQFNSTIAFLELKRARKRIKKYNFELKICQIQRPSFEASKTDQKNILTDCGIVKNSITKIEEVNNRSLQPLLSQKKQINAINERDTAASTITYEFKGKHYYKKRETLGDGACALHALMHNSHLNHKYVFSLDKNAQSTEIGKKAKEYFLDQVLDNQANYKNLIYDCLLEFVRSDKKLYTNYERSIKKEKEEQQSAIENCKAYILQEQSKDPLFFSKVYPMLRKSKAEYELMDDKILKKLLKNDKDACYNAYCAVRDETLPLLNNRKGFAKIQDECVKSNEGIKLKSENILLTNEYWHLYSANFLKTSYHLSDRELEFAATLFNKKVILFSGIQEPQILNAEGKKTVYILHDGNHQFGHYSRLSHYKKIKEGNANTKLY
ncbi:MAG: hypothetical protein H0V82_08035 [Candidatus Protochlamydia sp.]|nr:hypothetical protein [Candidatus Protochlamydia sp.]